MFKSVKGLTLCHTMHVTLIKLCVNCILITTRVARWGSYNTMLPDMGMLLYFH